LTLRLVGGSIHAFNEHDHSYHRTDFTTYDISLDLNVALANLRPREKDPSEMTFSQLRTAIAAKRRAHEPAFSESVELQRKFSIPFACLAFAALGVPLGIRPSRAVRSRGFLLSLAFIFLYYLLLTLGESLGERGILPAGVALWIPNVLLTALALGFLRRVTREGVVTRGTLMGSWFMALRARFTPLARPPEG
jgi:lipopolysaccharide export system permease protein